VLAPAPPPSAAQPSTTPPRIGVLELEGSASRVAALRGALRDLGYVDHRAVVIEHRSAEGRPERLADLAADLVRSSVDVIVARGTAAALGARHVTSTIPIVMAPGGDPVFAGLVKSLARPGGNVTGLHGLAPSELAGTRLRLLKELVPRLSRVAVLVDTGDVYAQMMLQDLEKVARGLGVRLHAAGVSRPAELDRAFEAAILETRVDALVALESVLVLRERARVVGFASMSRLPAIYGLTEFVEAGGLIAYGIDGRDVFRRAATYVDRILRGAAPGDLPVERPTRFELAINLQAARALGLTVPPALRARADVVISDGSGSE
jgi:putative ABC transport system substrate-binding protein